MMEKRLETYLESARKGFEWAIGLINPDGSFRGSEDSITGFFKAPLALATAGYIREATHVLSYVGKHFYADGNFHGQAREKVYVFGNYQNGWLAWGAHNLGAYQYSYPVADFLAQSQDEKSGAVPEQVEADPAKQKIEWGSSAQVINAFLAMGRLDRAIMVGKSLVNLLESQPDPDNFLFLRKSWSGEWKTEFNPALTNLHRIEFGKAGVNMYWFFGIAMAALGNLYAATGDKQWLDAAERVFQLTKKCDPEVYHHLTSAKVGWGASVLYGITGEKQYQEVLLQVADMLVETQTEEGAWLRRPDFETIEGHPVPPLLDTTLERCIWLYVYVKELKRSMG